LPSGHFVDESNCKNSTTYTDANAGGAEGANSSFTQDTIRACRGRPCNDRYEGIALGGGGIGPAIKFDPNSGTTPAPTSGASAPLELVLDSVGGTIYLVNANAGGKSDVSIGLATSSLLERRLNGAAVNVDVDEVLAAFLKPLPVESDANVDFMTRINLPFWMDESYFLYSSNSVFAKMKPGLLAILSAGLLNPKLETVDGRLFPGFCPGPVQHSSIFAKGQLSDLLQIHLDMNVKGTLVEVAAAEQVNNWSPEVDLIEYTKEVVLFNTEIGIEYNPINLDRSTVVIFVIMLSLVIAVAIGVQLAILVLGFAKDSVKGFLDFLQLCDEVIKLFTEVERPQEAAASGEGAQATKVADSTKLVSKTKLRMKKMKDMQDSRAKTKENIVYKTLGLNRSYYQLGEFVVKTLKNSSRDSITEFTNQFKLKNASTLQVDGIRHSEFSQEYEMHGASLFC
jgi:hypothetical protein